MTESKPAMGPYVLAALLGALAFGVVVVLLAVAARRIMSRAMAGMMKQMMGQEATGPNGESHGRVPDI